MLYDILVKPFVKNQSAEKASKAALRYFRIINSIPGLRPFYRFIHGNKAAGMEREVFGIKFYNPVGLGAYRTLTSFSNIFIPSNKIILNDY